MEFGYYEENDYIVVGMAVIPRDNADVYIMEESLLEEFKKQASSLQDRAREAVRLPASRKSFQ